MPPAPLEFVICCCLLLYRALAAGTEALDGDDAGAATAGFAVAVDEVAGLAEVAAGEAGVGVAVLAAGAAGRAGAEGIVGRLLREDCAGAAGRFDLPGAESAEGRVIPVFVPSTAWLPPKDGGIVAWRGDCEDCGVETGAVGGVLGEVAGAVGVELPPVGLPSTTTAG